MLLTVFVVIVAVVADVVVAVVAAVAVVADVVVVAAIILCTVLLNVRMETCLSLRYKVRVYQSWKSKYKWKC